GCVGEWRGSSRTSSNVRATASRMRDGCDPLSLMRDGPLPWSGLAGRDDFSELLVAIAKVNRPQATGQRPQLASTPCRDWVCPAPLNQPLPEETTVGLEALETAVDSPAC